MLHELISIFPAFQRWITVHQCTNCYWYRALIYYIILLGHESAKNHLDSFCYVCCELILKAQRKLILPLHKTAYQFRFHSQVGDNDKDWATNFCCTTCYSSLTKWLKSNHKSIPFAVLMVWRESRCHLTVYYFCMTSNIMFSYKNRHAIQYSNIPSALTTSTAVPR